MSDDFFETVTQSPKAQRRMNRKKNKEVRQLARTPKPIEPKTETQAEYLGSLREGDQCFAVGGAGTGKTYLAARHAMERLLKGEVDHIVLARPTVSDARHRLGFLPGNKDEKLAEWLVPLVAALKEGCAPSEYVQFVREGKIEFQSFEHIRGRTFNNSVVLLDEAQNCTVKDLITFLTRQGMEAQVIVNGDTDQVDIHDSGLEKILDMIELYDFIEADIIEFGPEDVVRSPRAKQWVKAISLAKDAGLLTPA